MRITGQIVEYHPGSKTARALFGMMAGSTKVKAHIKVVDAADGSLLFEDDVDGKVTYWSPNQDSKGATEGLAKEVAKKIKKRFA
jgi:curli biogenesis system outer membrane secretion channel CsgG